jgi:hypothetical protein
MILVKNNEAFVISKSTYMAINEWWSWEDVKSSYKSFKNKVVNYTNKAVDWGKEKVQQAKEVTKKSYNSLKEITDDLSAGAKKAWEWVKSAASAVVKFASEMSWTDWASLSLGVISAVIGIVGAPFGGTVLSGSLIAIAGSLDIYGGVKSYMEAEKSLEGIEMPLAKEVNKITQALPKIALGSVGLLMGITD